MSDISIHPTATTTLEVRVQARVPVAEGIVAIDLQEAAGGPLPPFTAGAHIDVELPVKDDCGRSIVRQYSLCNDPAERGRYRIAVGRDPQSRGGSTFLHDRLGVGDTLRISEPRNHFQLHEEALDTVLVAGGIGVTPLLAMARRLSALRRRWRLYLCARTPERAAFLDELRSLPGEVITVYDGVPGGKSIDLERVVGEASPGTHLYCCGPAGLMEAFERATASRLPHTVHVEWFKARAAAGPSPAAGVDRPFEVTLARSGRRLQVPADKSILDVLTEAGVEVPHSCCDGVCGTCETRVLEGLPDHRDSVLLGPDAKAQDRIMVCVSRSATPQMTLDL